MANLDGEWEVRMFYETIFNSIPMEHRLTFDVRPDPLDLPSVGDPFGGVNLSPWVGAGMTLNTQVDEIVALLLPMYHTTTTINRAELWRYTGGGSSAINYSNYTIGEDGTATPTTIGAQQTTFTWRTRGGSTMRMQLMESAFASNAALAYPTSNADLDAIFDYIFVGVHAIVGRDNTRPEAPLKCSSGQNEKLFRKRYRG